MTFDVNYDVSWYTDSSDGTHYTISTAEQAAGLAAIVNGYAADTDKQPISKDDFTGKTVTLSDNLKVDGKLTEWFPIGEAMTSGEERMFNGTFDGSEKTVEIHLEGFNKPIAGFFGCLDTNAHVKNLNISGTIGGTKYVGGVCGYSKGIIQNCHNRGNNC